MSIARVAARSLNYGLLRQFHLPHLGRSFSTNDISGDNNDGRQNSKKFESADDFEQRIFGDFARTGSGSDSFYQKLDRLRKAKSGLNPDDGQSSDTLGDLHESFSTLTDDMDRKLKKEAAYFEFDINEVMRDDYNFRPDVNFQWGTTYDIKDLDLRKPGVWKPSKRREFEVTTEEVLRKADFRNVRFLANFITPAGIMIKRSKTGISAKAQRKVAREIKTARAFGLMPFTTMGTKSFVFGQSMEPLDRDYEYDAYGE